MSLNSSANQSVVQTDLDDVFYQEFDIAQHPGHATAETSAIFMPESSEKANEIMEVFTPGGAWTETPEEGNFTQGNPKVDQRKIFTHTKFAQVIQIPKEFYDDNMHGTYEKMVKSFATRARTTRDRQAFSVFRNGFTTATTADSVAWFSDSHTNGAGNTVDNLAAATALDDTALKNMFQLLGEQEAQDGEIDGHVGATLVVPMALFPQAIEITKSELQPGTADNNMGYFSNLFPGLQVFTSPYLGSAAGGSDTAYFLLSRNHSLMRFVRESVNTSLVDFEITDNDVYKYKGRYRESVGAMTYEGAIGSAGA